jgi:SSS family solute:Na+ symporter/sodium/pantothenate symporter
MRAQPLIWGLFAVYLVGTSVLAYLGHRKTKDIRSFAVGGGDMHPAIVGVTLAASIASTATFVINPGFVYVHGLSALMHLGIAAGLGVIVGLVTMSTGFRRIGAKTRAITLPQWIGERYRSRGLTVLFAAINLLSLSFVVLIVGGLSIVMQQTLGLSNTESLVLIIGFVFSYIFVGGTYAHAYTNTLQGFIMVVVSAWIVASGFGYLSGTDVLDALAARGPELATAINPKSALFSSFFSVFVCGFVVGFALVCQPHIMTKALYVKTDKAVRRYLAVTIAVSTVFSALLLVGLYVHLMDLPREAFVDPATGLFRQDRVMAVYLAESFGPVALAFITVALLAAGMSTLDGILVALSSIAANDLFLNLTRDNVLAKFDPQRQGKIAHRASQAILVAMGVAALIIGLDPPKLLGIFGQVGVYGMIAASAVPILFGILFPKLGVRTALASALAGLTVHFGLYAWGAWALARKIDLVGTVQGWGPLQVLFDTSAVGLGLQNPAVTATYGLLVSAACAAGVVAVDRVRSREPGEAEEAASGN